MQKVLRTEIKKAIMTRYFIISIAIGILISMLGLPGRRFRWRSRRRKLPQRIITKGDEQFLLQDRYADRVQGNHERRCCDIYNIEQPGTPVLFKYTILRGTVANPKPVGRNDRCV